MEYPKTRKEEVYVEKFGHKVLDAYRWLENDNSEETAEWVEAQNKVTFSYLEKIPFRDKIKKRVTELLDYPKYSAPFKRKGHYFFFKNTGLQNQPVLYIQDSLEDEPRVFIDPNKFSEDGTSALSTMAISKEGKYFSYGVQKSGSDWEEISVKEVSTGNILKDKITWAKFPQMAWYKDGFYYNRYPKPKKGKEYSSKNEDSKIYYHKLGTSQDDDELIYEDKTNKKRRFGAMTTKDSRYLIISETEGTSGNSFLVKDLQNNGEFIRIVDDLENDYDVVDNIDDKLLVFTNDSAPNYKLVLIDPKKPSKTEWKDLVPEQKISMEAVSTVGGKIIINYIKDACSALNVHDLNGKFENTIDLPGPGTAVDSGGDKDDDETFYLFYSFTTPPTTYRYNLKSGKSELFRKTEVNFDVKEYETVQKFYHSKDGTKVPMFVTYKKGISLNGENPTILYGYGGFNISLTPSFMVSYVTFLEKGGVLAIPNIRGGGEYGEKWHREGMLLKKQNCFDDLISAAEFLISEKYTCASKLAIEGGSNGGLLVGTVINQRPDLFKAALPAVGVMDMLRFHKFTIGDGWIVEYGDPEKKEDFENLLKYSPLHNLSEKKYPAVLVTTADHDDRVVPAHSFKYISALQDIGVGESPYLIRIDVKSGHGMGKPISKRIEELADVFSFLMYNLDMSYI